MIRTLKLLTLSGLAISLSGCCVVDCFLGHHHYSASHRWHRGYYGPHPGYMGYGTGPECVDAGPYVSQVPYNYVQQPSSVEPAVYNTPAIYSSAPVQTVPQVYAEPRNYVEQPIYSTEPTILEQNSGYPLQSPGQKPCCNQTGETLPPANFPLQPTPDPLIVPNPTPVPTPQGAPPATSKATTYYAPTRLVPSTTSPRPSITSTRYRTAPVFQLPRVRRGYLDSRYESPRSPSRL